ncbi:MAG TPA: hypothetical protein VGM18_04940 [Candidatus Sulfotelmatobacter sp.]|jgi:hypothetical protein
MHPILCFAFAFTSAVGLKGLIACLAALGAAALFGTTITAQTPGPMVAPTSPDYDTIVGQSSNLPFQFEVLTGTTDVITGGGGLLGNGATPPICGTSFIETAGVDACTLATPVAGSPAAGGNDGLEITIIDNSAHAHTVTTAAGKIIPAHHLMTFNGTQGSFVTLVARNGFWIPVQQSGVTIS